MNEPKCINLKEMFGDRYRIGLDESTEGKWTTDPWMYAICGHYGHIYPHGGKMLGVATDRRGAIAKRIAALPYTEVTQDGADGINSIFHVADIEDVLDCIKPRRRRQVTEEQRVRGRELYRKYLAGSRSYGDKTDPETHASGQGED